MGCIGGSVFMGIKGFRNAPSVSVFRLEVVIGSKPDSVSFNLIQSHSSRDSIDDFLEVLLPFDRELLSLVVTLLFGEVYFLPLIAPWCI